MQQFHSYVTSSLPVFFLILEIQVLRNTHQQPSTPLGHDKETQIFPNDPLLFLFDKEVQNLTVMNPKFGCGSAQFSMF